MALVRRGGWVFTLALVGGLLIGSLIGEACAGNQFLWWLGYGIDFGFSLPENVMLDVYIMELNFSFGIWFHFNIASILGLAASWLIFRKW